MHGTGPLNSARMLFQCHKLVHRDFVNIVEYKLLHLHLICEFTPLQQTSSDSYLSALWSSLTEGIKNISA